MSDRPESGHLLPSDDPRVAAAAAASRCLGDFDWRDIAEIVNAVLEADDRTRRGGIHMTETTTKTVTIDYDEEGRVVQEVTKVVVVTRNERSTGNERAAVDELTLHARLAVDAEGFVWWSYEDGSWSMVRVNPDNEPIPQPVTFYEPVQRQP